MIYLNTLHVPSNKPVASLGRNTRSYTLIFTKYNLRKNVFECQLCQGWSLAPGDRSDIRGRANISTAGREI